MGDRKVKVKVANGRIANSDHGADSDVSLKVGHEVACVEKCSNGIVSKRELDANRDLNGCFYPLFACAKTRIENVLAVAPNRVRFR